MLHKIQATLPILQYLQLHLSDEVEMRVPATFGLGSWLNVLFHIVVLTSPEQTALTLMLYGGSSRAITFVNPTTPALAVEYATEPGFG